MTPGGGNVMPRHRAPTPSMHWRKIGNDNNINRVPMGDPRRGAGVAPPGRAARYRGSPGVAVQGPH
eukprot:2200807-Lingulodinium_polyedra.AAC.1